MWCQSDHDATQVLGLLAAALEAGSDALVGHLLRECDLPGWLASAPLWVTPLPRDSDPRCSSLARSLACGLTEAPAMSCQDMSRRSGPVGHQAR